MATVLKEKATQSATIASERISRKSAKPNKPFWPCGGDTGLGCGCECWSLVPHVLQIKLPGKRTQGAVFCSKCAKKPEVTKWMKKPRQD